MIKYVIFIYFILNGLGVHANTTKWCEPTGKRYDIHLFGHTYNSPELERLAKKGISDLKSMFIKGDKVRIFTHSNAGFSPAFDQCVPGCPKRSALESFFGSDCSEQVAKRESVNFDQRFALIVLTNFKSSEARTKYNIFANIQQLSDVYRGGRDDGQVYAVISLIPDGVSPRDRRALNDLYRQANETLQFPKDFPAIKIIGAATDSELLDFWKDVFRTKGTFNFVAF